MRRLLSPLPLAVALCAAALLALLAYGLDRNEPDRGIERALAQGERRPAPKLDLPMLWGEGRGSLGSYRGRVVVLNFWASWCAPCRDEAPLLERWHRRIEPQGGTVLGVDALDSTDDAREFVRRFGISYPNVRDVSGERLRPFGIAAYPETFVIDRRGRIAALVRGPVTEEFLAREVPPLLGERT